MSGRSVDCVRGDFGLNHISWDKLACSVLSMPIKCGKCLVVFNGSNRLGSARDKQISYRVKAKVNVWLGVAPLDIEVRRETGSGGFRHFHWCCGGSKVFLSVHPDNNNILHTNPNWKIVQDSIIVCIIWTYCRIL